MSKVTLHYSKGYKGQVRQQIEFKSPIRPARDINTEFITLSRDGHLCIKSGYAYDFASGPTFDWPEWIRAAALAHDALCQLYRECYLTPAQRKETDEWFRRILKANGMNPIRRALWFRGVRVEAASEHGPKEVHKVELEVPE